ncbi:DUF1638 domain-containing protein [Phyllobacterium sp. YR531]|uniref:DUF1638 domain-containing protein n=1 Tax=Phyllobacterium sp. YR531 TaxID=1144343 RepID=UPI00026F7E34|nr:DUF1638 domain-containing protein [Phyllobacterium sp. YR531]EJN03976.1 Protein of unknown function (DUF1638) [Phyllobacterium sp. YR531]
MNVSRNQKIRPETVRVIACGMIAREILAIRQQFDLEHLQLTCLPAEYHHYPDKIAPSVEQAIKKAKAEGVKNIFIGYADCGTGGLLDRVCEKHGVERIAGPHCFSFYAGNDLFAAQWDEDMTSFFMTDFLARHFDAFMVRPLGLDRHPELREMYFGNYRKMIYMAQTDDPELSIKAKKAAEFLGLAYERRLTGYGDLVPALRAAANH